MSNRVLGLVPGGTMGVFHGVTAWFTAEARRLLLGIATGSTLKGLVAGLAIGFFSKKVHSLPWGIVFGLAVGLFFAFLVASMPQPSGKHYYFEIMLPGAIVGAIVGYATQVWRGKRLETA